jgi:hypothetical protein
MAGLEVLAAVAGIIAVFNGSTTTFQEWVEENNRRETEEQNQKLARSLMSGTTEIQDEYDAHFSRLGPKFSSGDGVQSAISDS